MPTPEPTPTTPPLSPEAQAALAHITEQKKIPPNRLVVTSEELRDFPQLGRRFVLVTLLHDQADAPQSYRVLVDPTSKAVERDFDGILLAEQAAAQDKYGKFDPALYDKLQSSKDDEVIPIVIWAAEAGEEDAVKAAEQEVAQLYPEAAKALAERGVAWSVEDEALRLEIKQKFAELLAERSAKRIEPIVTWLEEKGYSVEKVEGSPIVAAALKKQDILALAELTFVSQIQLGGGETAPSSTISIPTSRVPIVWSRGMTGSGVRLAIVEADKINNMSRNCLSVIATRDNTLPDSDHKSRVSAIASCDDTTKRGVAYNAQILDAGYSASGTMVTAAEALNWAVTQNLADITNQSERFLNQQLDTNLYYLDMFYDYLVRVYDFTAVISAGNKDYSNNVATPGKGWNVITVGNAEDQNTASWSDDKINESASGSSYINPSTGVEKPEVAAPGTNIDTVAGERTGTSYSAPHVAGLAALLMQRKTVLKDYPAAVKAIIMASAVHNLEGNRNLSDYDGAGSIDAAIADQIAQTEGGAGVCNVPCWWYIPINDTNLPEPSAPPQPSNFLNRSFSVNRGEHIRVVISWLSSAAADGTLDQLRTELNLHVKRQNGTVIKSSTSSVNGFEIVEFVADSTGTYTIAVERLYLGLYNESDNTLGIAWVKQATYLSDLRRNIGGWTSNLYVRNDGAWPRNVTVTFINQNGDFNSDLSNLLNKDADWIVVPPNNWQGSAIVDGNEDLSVVVSQERSGTYTHEAYAGVGNPTSAVRVPIYQKNNSGIYSDLFVQNAGVVDLKVDLQFYASTGNSPICNDFQNFLVKPGAAFVIAAGSLTAANSCDVGAIFVGAIQVSNSENQPLAVASTQYKDSGGVSQLYETSNTELPATTVYAPLIQNNNNGNLAGLTLSRTGGGSFDVRYYNKDSGVECSNQLGLANNPQVIYPAPPAGNGCPTVALAKFQAGSTMTANVNQLKASGNATTYSAIAAPSKVAIVAKVRKDNGWNDGFVIANFNAVAANVTVRLYNTGGTLISTPINNQSLGSNQSLIVLGQIPANFNGSAIVTADQPVAVSVNSLQVGAGDVLGSYPANQR